MTPPRTAHRSIKMNQVITAASAAIRLSVLTDIAACAKRLGDMKSPLALAATAALITLAACNSQAPEVVDANPDPMAAELANRAPVELPPAMKADKSMRCQPGNILLYVTFFQGDKLAFVRTEKGGAINRLTAEKAGDPLTAAGGWKLTGTPTSAKISVPGKADYTCKG